MEWFGTPSRRMVMKLSLTVQLTDDLTGLPVTGSNARVWIEGQKPPIGKADGRSIFVDLPVGEYTLNAEGGFYSHTEVSCRITEDRAECITIRLLPNKQYPLPKDLVKIEGRAEPDTLIRAYSADRNSGYKLLSDTEKGNTVIGIYHGAGININGKLMKIISSDDNSEYIRIMSLENEDRSEYLLSEKLTGVYPKIGTVIVPVSECKTDSAGNFMLLLKNGKSGTQFIFEYKKKKRTIRKTIELSDTNYIKADLT